MHAAVGSAGNFTRAAKFELGLARLVAGSHTQILVKRIYTARLRVSVTLVVKVLLLSLLVGEHGVATTVRVRPREHDSLRAQTALHFEVLLLALDQRNHVAAQKHLHFSVAVLKELVLSDFGLVPEQVHQDVDDRLEELEIIEVYCIMVDSVAEEVLAYALRRSKNRVVQNF
eukprot:CAMPEP_0170468776 /NCGR_PEP_ID=MMETSP0123-20130129/11828_1 /TAXON_ID=182087 /ORGANISM="Favella ehrenbergii, Strain Fehren 1" /LENGTH=171 /DNA_ID=CAMNT_0010735427 /DNA_START=752 /DNA_END=1267 /DNA_ORIENTATION=+